MADSQIPMAFMSGHISVALAPLSISFFQPCNFFPTVLSIWNSRVLLMKNFYSLLTTLQNDLHFRDFWDRPDLQDSFHFGHTGEKWLARRARPGHCHELQVSKLQAHTPHFSARTQVLSQGCLTFVCPFSLEPFLAVFSPRGTQVWVFFYLSLWFVLRCKNSSMTFGLRGQVLL